MRKAFLNTAMMIFAIMFPAVGKSHEALVDAKRIEVKGLRYLNENELFEQMRYTMDKGIMKINIDSLKEAIAKNPMVYSSQLRVVNGGVVVEIVEKEPVYVCVVEKKGESIPFELDKDFRLISVRTIHRTDVPIVVFKELNMPKGQLSKRVISILKKIANLQRECAPLYREISEIALRDDGLCEIRLRGRKTKCIVRDFSFSTLARIVSVFDGNKFYPDALYVSHGFGVIK
ncbi:MAG: FtsQ-type POTRA domain-containing protein [Spirochaetes bacterium]|nr:FtsQ-type POTRA domain-containing protein [Spirochaetota bacterium]